MKRNLITAIKDAWLTLYWASHCIKEIHDYRQTHGRFDNTGELERRMSVRLRQVSRPKRSARLAEGADFFDYVYRQSGEVSPNPDSLHKAAPIPKSICRK